MASSADRARSIERVLHKYMQLQDVSYLFGEGVRLTQREIHVIDAIGNNPDANLTQLAEIQGVTKGAMSQMVYRLVDKGYVRKTAAPDSDKEVRLSLTPSGQSAYREYKRFHEKRAGDAMDVLDSLTPEESRVLDRIVSAFENMMDEALAEARS